MQGRIVRRILIASAVLAVVALRWVSPGRQWDVTGVLAIGVNFLVGLLLLVPPVRRWARYIGCGRGGIRAREQYRVEFTDDVIATIGPIDFRGRGIINVHSDWPASGSAVVRDVGDGATELVPRGGLLCDGPTDADYCLDAPGGTALTIAVALVRGGRQVHALALRWPTRGNRAARVTIEILGHCEVGALPREITVEVRTRGFPVTPAVTPAAGERATVDSSDAGGYD